MMTQHADVVEEYPHDCRIVREQREGEEPRFHYEGPMGRVKSFPSEGQARLYADVQTVTGGFREEKTGERGAPPAVARGPRDVLMAYYASNPTMSVEWVARTFDVDEDDVRAVLERVRARAEGKRVRYGTEK